MEKVSCTARRHWRATPRKHNCHFNNSVLSADMGKAAALATDVMNFRRGVAAEEQNGVGTPYILPKPRRLKCRIDPEQNAYTCVLREHKPGRRGREMIDLLAVEEPKSAKIRAVSYEAAIEQLFKRMRSSSSAPTQQAVSTPRGQVPNDRRRRRPPHGRRTGTTG